LKIKYNKHKVKIVCKLMQKFNSCVNSTIGCESEYRSVHLAWVAHEHKCEGNCCKEIVTTINNMLNEKKTGPIVMKWKEEDEKGKQRKDILQQNSS
jgi:hypothetical protein